MMGSSSAPFDQFKGHTLLGNAFHFRLNSLTAPRAVKSFQRFLLLFNIYSLPATVYPLPSTIYAIINFMKPTFDLENKIVEDGYTLIAGIDEAGRGPWAGPLVAAAVILDIKNFTSEEVNDSKKLTAKKREALSPWIKENCLAWAVGEVSSEEIDTLGLQLGNKTAMKRAIEKLDIKPEFILTDYVGKIDFRTPFRTIKSGDQISLSIASASIIAKVYRDGLMQDLAKQYPLYGFEKHKGYGTKLHQEMIQEHGICPIHRQCFKPIKRLQK